MNEGEGMEYRVYYDEWEMACCGTLFGIGDIVEWEISENNKVLTPVNIGNIYYCYDAHSFDTDKILFLTGKVKKIKILYHKYMPKSHDTKTLVAVDGILLDANMAEGHEEDFEDMEAAGYVVELSECIIKRHR